MFYAAKTNGTAQSPVSCSASNLFSVEVVFNNLGPAERKALIEALNDIKADDRGELFTMFSAKYSVWPQRKEICQHSVGVDILH